MTTFRSKLAAPFRAVGAWLWVLWHLAPLMDKLAKRMNSVAECSKCGCWTSALELMERGSPEGGRLLGAFCLWCRGGMKAQGWKRAK